MQQLVLEEVTPEAERAFEEEFAQRFEEDKSGYPQVKRSRYGTAERVFAFICFVLGYFLIRTFNGAGLGATVTTVLLTAVLAVYMNSKGAVQRAPHYVYLAATALFSSVFVLSDDGFIKALAAIFIFFALMFYPYFTHGSGRREFINDMFVFDMIKSALIMPFSSLASIFPAAFSGKRAKKSGFRAWHIVVGLCIAALPTFIVATLLCSADAGFTNLLNKAADFFSHGIFDEILWFIAGTPVAMYVFGMLYSNGISKHQSVLTRYQHETFRRAVSVIPQAIAYAAVTPLCVLYVVFLSVQANYYFGGFLSNLPDGLTYAEYARSGFFELCAVAVINMVVIILLAVFTKKKADGKATLPLKVYSIVLSCFTLLLIAVAASKMFTYIDAYVLSRLRIFTSWFMVLLSFAFIFIIVKQIYTKFNYFGALAAVFAVLFGALCFCDVDARIAEYNVNAYITDSKKTIDTNQLSSLSDSAVPYIVKLTQPVEGRSDEENEAVTYKAAEILSKRKREYANGYDYIHFNYPRYVAEKAAEPF